MVRKNCQPSSSTQIILARFFASVCFVLLVACSRNTDGKNVDALVGSSVDLPCKVDTAQCGDLHSVKWYRDTSRIYVYSQFSAISRAEGNATKRMLVDYSPNSTEALLKIKKVELQDEANYKCEITYLEVRENCDVVQIIKLQTLVEPGSPRIFPTLGERVNQEPITNSTYGPHQEGKEIELTCETLGGKPEPTVEWYNGSQKMNFPSTSIEQEGLYTAKSKLRVTLSRGDLKARYVCKVNNRALKEPMVSWINLDVHVKPSYMTLTFQEQVVQGSNVLLICDVFGANPAADVKWYNNSDPITNDNLIQTVPEAVPENGTFNTKSELEFKATRWDDGRNFYCYAENAVTKNQSGSTFRKQVLIQVKYPPVVTVAPENITLTENQTESILLRCIYNANPTTLIRAFWMKDGQNITLDKDKYEGGVAQHPPLTIKNVNRDDMGRYTCTCMNEVGATESENSVYLNVEYPPTVEVNLDPPVPVKSVEGVNVTAICNVKSGNPDTLLKVRWLLGNELLKELPECSYNDTNSTGGLYCNVDPSILSLVTVDQSFAGNYMCQGMNAVGWGKESPPTELIVYYPPSPAKLTYSPSKVTKKGQVELKCSVGHPGRPENLSYIWHRGIHRMSGHTWANLTINPVKLDTRNNFTCRAVNEGGVGDSDTVFINVSAPPTFITPLTYQHVRSYQSNMSLTCRVECSPLCTISWFKENEHIDKHNPLYHIKTTIRDANGKTGDFESVESTLIWNFSAWPTHPFAKTTPPANYMCISSSNGVGSGVNASVVVEVEYPPENLTLSSRVVSVVEGKKPQDVECSGKGFPDLHYSWKRNSTGKVLSETQFLRFPTVTRADSDSYICEASNIHGSNFTAMYLLVEYPPSCTIIKTEYEGSPALLCTVDAKPQDVSFWWKIQGSNETASDEQLVTRQEGSRGYLLLSPGVDTFRTYQCNANNSAGTGRPCEIDVTGVAAPWWHIFGSDNILILVAIIAGIILCAIFVCIIIIIIICVCRRRRARNKLPNQSTTADRGRLGGGIMNDGSTDPLTNNADKGFYENLPFHGMQTPPNKTNGATTGTSDTYIF